MFETLYKTVDSKIQPSLELVNETKQKMKLELNNSNKVRHVNFYKYATIAACLVIFLGVLNVNPTKDIQFNNAPSMNETFNEAHDSVSSGNKGQNPFNSANFESGNKFDSIYFESAGDITVDSKNSILDRIVEFFVKIIQWFKELLF